MPDWQKTGLKLLHYRKKARTSQFVKNNEWLKFKLRKILIYLALPLVFMLTGARQMPAGEKEIKPKNFIIVIVDGAGVAEWSAGAAMSSGGLQVGKFPYMGLMKVWGGDNFTPDAYANATAIATGQRTTDGILSMNSNGVPMKTLAECARDRKMLTGLISVSSVTSASAAAFFDHEDLGVNDEKIALGITKFKPDILIGGGKKYFSDRADKRNLVDTFMIKRYEMITKQKKAEKFTGSKTFALLSDEDMPQVVKRGNFLSEVCLSAIRNMAACFEGYFLIIHDGHIGQAMKYNSPGYMCEEIKDVNRALATLYNTAPNMDETLVVVLSPGETGGFVFNGGSVKSGAVFGSWASQKPTATMVPVFASGPGAEKFAGIYDNTDVFAKVLSLMR